MDILNKGGDVPPNAQQPTNQAPMPVTPGIASYGPEQQFVPPANPNQPVGSATQPQQPAATPQHKNNSTQNSLLLSELRDGMVIMADGTFRAVIACKSINFDLMSSREREGVEFSYQNFLNALYFPIQIFIRSQRVDIGPYISGWEKRHYNKEAFVHNIRFLR